MSTDKDSAMVLMRSDDYNIKITRLLKSLTLPNIKIISKDATNKFKKKKKNIKFQIKFSTPKVLTNHKNME